MRTSQFKYLESSSTRRVCGTCFHAETLLILPTVVAPGSARDQAHGTAESEACRRVVTTFHVCRCIPKRFVVLVTAAHYEACKLDMPSMHQNCTERRKREMDLPVNWHRDQRQPSPCTNCTQRTMSKQPRVDAQERASQHTRFAHTFSTFT
jgi:hypothetical protein